MVWNWVSAFNRKTPKGVAAMTVVTVVTSQVNNISWDPTRSVALIPRHHPEPIPNRESAWNMFDLFRNEHLTGQKLKTTIIESSNRSHVKKLARRVWVVLRSTSSFLVGWMGFHLSPHFPTYNWSGSLPSLSVPPDISHPNNFEVGLGLKIHIHTCTCIPISCHTMPNHTTASPYVTVYGMLHRIHTLHFISLRHIKLQYYIHYIWTMWTSYIHTSCSTVYTLYGHCGLHIPWYSY